VFRRKKEECLSIRDSKNVAHDVFVPKWIVVVMKANSTMIKQLGIIIRWADRRTAAAL
jgi:hypothetical protein